MNIANIKARIVGLAPWQFWGLWVLIFAPYIGMVILLALIPASIWRIFGTKAAMGNLETSIKAGETLTRAQMKKTFLCKSCGHVGAVKSDAKGSILIEIVLWCCFLLPGLIYTLWRDSNRYKKCPVCGSTEIIPLNSPIGREVVEKMKQA